MGVLSVCESKKHCGSFEGGEGGRQAYVFTQAPAASISLLFWVLLVGGPYFAPDCGKGG